MTYRCVVVDDEKPARERLKRLLAEHEDFQVVAEAANATTAIQAIEQSAPDLCFLDVKMPEGDGFEVLRGLSRMPAVIFTTAYDEYAVRAFEVNSLDYLLKPFGKRRLAEALDRARQTLGREGPLPERVLSILQELRDGMQSGTPATVAAGAGRDRPMCITAKRGSKILLLHPEEVLWLEADDALVFARTTTGRFLVERTLADLELLLSSGFFRSHRRFLVNLRQIAEIVPADTGTYEIVLKDPARSRVPLSRRQARRLRELIPW